MRPISTRRSSPLPRIVFGPFEYTKPDAAGLLRELDGLVVPDQRGHTVRGAEADLDGLAVGAGEAGFERHGGGITRPGA